MSKKLIIAISALALAIIAGAVAVVGVFAAQQQKVANTFTISYTADNVSAKIYFVMRDEKGNSWSSHEVGPDNLYPGYEIAPSQTEESNSFTLNNFTLTADNSYVLIVMEITNTASTGGKSFTVTVEDNSEKKNVNCYYSWTAGAWFPDLGVEANKTLPEANTVAPQEVCPLYIAIEIADNTLDAEYISTATAGIHFTMQAV